jgi:hypothetical protein
MGGGFRRKEYSRGDKIPAEGSLSSTKYKAVNGNIRGTRKNPSVTRESNIPSLSISAMGISAANNPITIPDKMNSSRILFFFDIPK